MSIGVANQDNFRGRDDTQGLNVNSFTQSLNANWTQTVDVPFRIRFDLEGAGSVDTGLTFLFYYSYNGGSYTPITTSSSPIKIVSSSQFTDNAATSTQLLTTNTSYLVGVGRTTNSSFGGTFGAGVVQENEGCFQIIGSAVSNGDTIAIRVYNSSGTTLNSYVQTPTITAGGASDHITASDAISVSDNHYVDSVTVSESVSVAIAAGNPKLETFIDTFDQPTLSANWNGFTNGGGTITAATNGISFNLPASSTSLSDADISAARNYDLTGSYGYVNAGQVLSASTNADSIFKVCLDVTNNYFVWEVEAGVLYAETIVGGVRTPLTSFTLSLTTHAYWRIRESGGTIFWDTSPDANTWTNKASVANPFAVTAIFPDLGAAAYENETNPGSFRVGGFNTTTLSVSVSDSTTTSETVSVVKPVAPLTISKSESVTTVEQSFPNESLEVVNVVPQIPTGWQTAGLNYPGTATSTSAVGLSYAWVNPTNAEVLDGTFTTSSDGTNAGNSFFLEVSNFGFSIPAGATIQGIMATVTRKSDTLAISDYITDNIVNLIKSSGALGSANKAHNTPSTTGGWWPLTNGATNYGGYVDLWGETLAPSDINSSNFGIALSASINDGDSLGMTASVDAISMTVYYTLPPGYSISVSDSSTTSESLSVAEVSFVSVSDNSTTSENIAVRDLNFISVTDSTTISETIARLTQSFIQVSDSTSISESITKLLVSFVSVGDSTATSEARSLVIPTLFITVSDNTTTSEAILMTDSDQPAILDTITTSENISISIATNINVSDSTSTSEIIGITLIDLVFVSDSTTTSENISNLLLSFVSVSDNTATGESVSVALASALSLAVNVNDSSTTSESITASGLIFISVVDASITLDGLNPNFFDSFESGLGNWAVVSGTPAQSSAQAYQGTFSANFTTSASTAELAYEYFNTLQNNPVYISYEFYQTSNPSSNTQVIRLTNAGGVIQAGLKILTSGLLEGVNSDASTGATLGTVASNAWNFIEWWYIPATGVNYGRLNNGSIVTWNNTSALTWAWLNIGTHNASNYTTYYDNVSMQVGSPQLSLTNFISVSDTSSTSENVSITEQSFIKVSDATTLTEIITPLITTLYLSVSDSTTMSESLLLLDRDGIGILDVISTSENVALNIPVQISVNDSTSTSETVKVAVAQQISVSDNTTTSEVTTVVQPMLISVNDSISTSETLMSDFALQFNGLSNYVEVPNQTAFSPATTGSLTVSAWMRPDVLNFSLASAAGGTEGAYVHWLGKSQYGGGNQAEWVFRMYNHDGTSRPNRISFYVFNLSGGLGIGSYFQDSVVAGTWINVVGVLDGTNVIIYRDGTQRQSSVYSPSITPTAGTANVRWGHVEDSSQNGFFEGAIDDVIIWNRALSSAEVSSIATGTPPASGIVGRWQTNEGSGTTVNDSSGNAYNGALEPSTPYPLWVPRDINIAGPDYDGLAVTDTVTTSENITLQATVNISVSDSTSISEAVNVAIQSASAIQVSVSDSTSTTELVRALELSFISVNDSISTSENIQTSLSTNINVSDSSTVSESMMSNQALHFNGINQYVDVPSESGFSIPTTGTLSVGAWVRPDVLDYSHSIGTGDSYVNVLGKSQTTPTEAAEWQMRIRNYNSQFPSRVAFYVFNSTGGLGMSALTDPVITPGNWVHILAVVNSNNVQMYYNGILQQTEYFQATTTQATATATVGSGQLTGVTITNAGVGYLNTPKVNVVGGGGSGAAVSATVSGGVISNLVVTNPGSGYTSTPSIVIGIFPSATTADFGIGHIFDSTSLDFFQGAIDNVIIWNYALSSTDVTNTYLNSPPTSGMVGWWKFDEGSGSTALDSSGNGYSGTEVNSPVYTPSNITITPIPQVFVGSFGSPISDSATISESVSVIIPLSTTVSDSTSTSETITVQLLAFVSVSDNISTSENIKIVEIDLISVSDSISTSENISTAISNLISVSDSISTSENLTELIISFINVSDSSSTSEAVTVLEPNYYISVSDSTTASEAILVGNQDGVIVSDAISTSESVAVVVLTQLSVSDSTTISEVVHVAQALQVSVVDITQTAEAGFGNIVTNGDFETGTGTTNANFSVPGWLVTQVVDASVVSVDTTIAQSGSQSIKIAIDSTDSNNGIKSASLMAVAPNTSYTLVVWLMGQQLGAIAPAMQLQIGDGMTGVLQTDQVTWNTTATYFTVPAPNTWTPFVLTFTTSATQKLLKINDFKRGGAGNQANNIYWIDNVQIYEAPQPLITSFISVNDNSTTSENISFTGTNIISVSDTTITSEIVSLNIAGQGAFAIDNIVTSETITLFILEQLSVSDTINSSDTVNVAQVDTLSVSDSINISDSVKLALADQIAVSDNTTVSESIKLLEQAYVSVSDNISTSDTAQAFIGLYFITVSDSINTTEAVNIYDGEGIFVTDGVAITEAVNLLISVLFISVNDSISNSESLNQTLVDLVAVTDSISTSENLKLALTNYISISDSVSTSEQIKALITSFVTVSDTINSSEAINSQITSLVNVSDSTTTSENVTVSRQAALSGNISVSDSITTSEAITLLIPVLFTSVTDSISTTEALLLTDQDGIGVMDNSSVTEAVKLAVSIPPISVNDTVSASEITTESIVSFVRVTDTSSTSESTKLTSVDNVQVSESITASETITIGRILVQIIVSDAVETAEALLLNGIFFVRTSDTTATSETLHIVRQHTLFPVVSNVALQPKSFNIPLQPHPTVKIVLQPQEQNIKLNLDTLSIKLQTDIIKVVLQGKS